MAINKDLAEGLLEKEGARGLPGKHMSHLGRVVVLMNWWDPSYFLRSQDL